MDEARAQLARGDARAAFAALDLTGDDDPILRGDVYAGLGLDDMALAFYGKAQSEPRAVDKMATLLRKAPRDTVVYWLYRAAWDIEDWHLVPTRDRWLLVGSATASDVLPLYRSLTEPPPQAEDVDLLVARRLIQIGTYVEEDMTDYARAMEPELIEASLSILSHRSWSDDNRPEAAELLLTGSAYLQRVPLAIKQLRSMAARGDDTGLIGFLVATASVLPESCRGKLCSVPEKAPTLRAIAELSYRHLCRTGAVTLRQARSERKELWEQIGDRLSKGGHGSSDFLPATWPKTISTNAIRSARRLLALGTIRRVAARLQRVEAAVAELEAELGPDSPPYRKEAYLYYRRELHQLPREASHAHGEVSRQLEGRSSDPSRYPEGYWTIEDLRLPLDARACDSLFPPAPKAASSAMIATSHHPRRGCGGCGVHGSNPTSALLVVLWLLAAWLRRARSRGR